MLASALGHNAPVFQALFVVVGVLWTVAYLLIIRRGFLDRTYGMPMAALCANVSWEFLYAFIWPQSAPEVAVNVTWFAFDLVLIGQFLRHGPAEHPEISRTALHCGFALGLATAFPIVMLVCRDLNQGRGGYAAFGMDLMMAILFVGMIVRRRSLRGQSFPIAVIKMAGSALAGFTAWQGGRIPPGTALLPALMFATLGWNLLYAGLVWRQARQEGVPLWRA